MADIQALERALVNADAAGDTDAVQVLAQEIKRARITPQTAPVTNTIAQLGRQVGLTARHGIEGAGDVVGVLTEPIRYGLSKVGIDVPSTAYAAKTLANTLGLPSPETPDERVVGAATKLMAGTGLFGAASTAAKAVPGMVGKAGEFLSANMPSQLTAAAGGGLAGETAKELGYSTPGQIGATVAGTVAGGLVPSVVNAGTAAVRSKLLQFRPQDIDAQVSATLSQAGIDYQTLGAGLRNQLREDVRSVLATGGDLDPAALARLVDFRRQGLTPTRGMITLDPVQITREQNLARMGANTSDPELQGLANLYNQNNRRVVNRLGTMGADRGDAFAAGQQAVEAITTRDANWQRRVSDLYGTARNMPGGDIPLDRKSVIDNIYSALARENKLAFLPEQVSDMLNMISAGQVRRNGQTFQVPFDANALDNLMTMISSAQRGTTDSNIRAALGIARRAIDNTPLQPVKNTFGGNQVVTQQTASAMRAADQSAPAFMDALNTARAEARARFGWQESSAPVESVINGMQPDKFIDRFVIKGTLADATAVANEANRATVRDAIVRHIYERASGGSATDVANISQKSLNKAINDIGDRKLSLFFSAEELADLRSLARAASYMQHQPTGSAVNNSNSGALLLGKGYDALQSLAGRFPMGRAIVTDPVNNIATRIITNRAQNIGGGLLAPTPETQRGFIPGLLAPLAISGGLLSQ